MNEPSDFSLDISQTFQDITQKIAMEPTPTTEPGNQTISLSQELKNSAETEQSILQEWEDNYEISQLDLPNISEIQTAKRSNAARTEND